MRNLLKYPVSKDEAIDYLKSLKASILWDDHIGDMRPLLVDIAIAALKGERHHLEGTPYMTGKQTETMADVQSRIANLEVQVAKLGMKVLNQKETLRLLNRAVHRRNHRIGKLVERIDEQQGANKELVKMLASATKISDFARKKGVDKLKAIHEDTQAGYTNGTGNGVGMSGYLTKEGMAADRWDPQATEELR